MIDEFFSVDIISGEHGTLIDIGCVLCSFKFRTRADRVGANYRKKKLHLIKHPIRVITAIAFEQIRSQHYGGLAVYLYRKRVGRTARTRNRKCQ